MGAHRNATPGQNLASGRDSEQATVLILAVVALLVGAVSGLTGGSSCSCSGAWSRFAEALDWRSLLALRDALLLEGVVDCHCNPGWTGKALFLCHAVDRIDHVRR